MEMNGHTRNTIPYARWVYMVSRHNSNYLFPVVHFPPSPSSSSTPSALCFSSRLLLVFFAHLCAGNLFEYHSYALTIRPFILSCLLVILRQQRIFTTKHRAHFAFHSIFVLDACHSRFKRCCSGKWKTVKATEQITTVCLAGSRPK